MDTEKPTDDLKDKLVRAYEDLAATSHREEEALIALRWLVGSIEIRLDASFPALKNAKEILKKYKM